MKEQKFLITSNEKANAMQEVNSLLEEGWLVVTMIPRAVSTTYSGTQHGAFAILFERENSK
jgi:hypothetical protein